MKKEVLMCLAAATVAAVNAEVRTAGPFEQTAISVAEGQSETETGPIRHDSLASGFAKDGAGAYTLPLGTVVQTTPLELSVHQGKVKLVDNGTAATVTAPDCLQNAKVWLDANDLAGDGSAIQTWTDHRGADGRPSMSQNTEANRPTSVSNAASKKWLYFGGYGSGKYGSLSSKINAIHAFAVVKQVGGLGFLWGMNANYYVSFHSSLTADLGSPYWNATESAPVVGAGQTYLDGRRIDGGTETVKAGIQLIEWEAGERPAPILNFFNDRGIAGRQGGDYLGEVVFFEKRLSDTERQQVEMYLLRKWKGVVKPSDVTVKTAEGTSVELGEGLANVAVKGVGTVEKSSAGALYDGDAVYGVNSASYHVANGGLVLEKGETKIALASGDALASAKDDYGVTTVTREADAADGTAQVTGGSGAFRVESIPAGVSNVTVNCGFFALGAAADPADGTAVPTTAAAVYATMENPGFEKFSGQQWNSGNWSSQGWTFSKGDGTASGSAWFVFQKGVGNYTSYGGNIPMPEGSYSMGFNFNGDNKGATATASTLVNFPQDGDYLLTFADAPRYPTWESQGSDNYNTYAGTEIELALTREGYARNSIATYYINGLWKKDAYRPERFLVRNVKAGSYSFEIKMTKTVDGGERLSIFDDFKFHLVESEVAETVFPVPNGDFEHYSLATPATFDLNRTAPGWTFTDGTGGANAVVGPLTPQVLGSVGGSSSADATYMPLPWFLGAGQRYGQCQLAFFGNGGAATSAAFVPTVGKWRLRCRVARQGSKMLQWNGQTINGDASFQAVVSVAGGAELSLGTIAVADSEFVSVTFPTPFSCDGMESVVLTLRQGNASGNLRVDDLELVRDDNLVAGGDFSSLNEWTTTSWIEMPNFSQYYGKTVLDGKALMVSKQMASTQKIRFPEPGLYLLSFWARGRAHYVNPDDPLPLMKFANNRVRFYLEKGSASLEIYRSEKINSTNFVHYAALFKVDDAADEYTFGLQGTETGDNNAWVDNVRIERVTAAAAPEIPAETDLDIRLADGEKLRLDYTGSTTVHGLKVNGHRLHGEVSATTYPDYVTGPGSLTATYRPGLILIVQ